MSESKQDWSSYEVPRTEAPEAPAAQQPAPAQPQQPAADDGPSDHEVEEALSGLTEMGSEQPAQPAAPQAHPQQPAAAEAEAEGTEEENGNGQKWSMEELRKNLTNMDRDS